jgi:aldehyde:ferredoxin oxidoreductase
MPSGKAKLVDYMTLFPQTDILGYGNVEGQELALSLGYDIDDYGHVYLTAHGMAWLAEQMGYIRVTKHEEKMLDSTSKLVQANERIAELEEQLNQLPMGVERIMNGLRDLSVSAVADLGGLTRPKRNNDGEEDSGSTVSVSEATG